MAEETTTTDNGEEAPELTLESVDSFDAENLSDDQKTFLEENKSDLTPEQAEKFGIEVEKKDDAPNPDDVDPETRGGKPKEDKPKDGEGEGEDDDLDPDDEKKISKVVKTQVSEAMKEVQAIKDQNEVNSFIRQNPEYAKYEAVVLKYMGHEAYRNIPVKNIMAMVSSNDMMKIGAQKEREAAKKAKDTQGGGTQQRKPAGGKVDWKNATKEDFEAEKQRVLQQR